MPRIKDLVARLDVQVITPERNFHIYSLENVKADEIADVNEQLVPGVGTCSVMGTASTMASMVESLGMGMPTNAAIPAADSRRKVLAQLAGRRIVQLVEDDVRMSRILTREAFENAVRTNGAIGGWTGIASNFSFDGGTLQYTGPSVGGINRAFTSNGGGATIAVTST